ncbi:hypothetical protein [Tateyamaria omphalii]|uniref:Uncharacterized protein n=1 Tax=Tateyamaria omphalii TaxID=299262 RepID=A0A1P8MWK4_9RHOB|nr:hypothetical protein [Tateyamaria omphalii]APX12444.1 hypothetical protein BWR18_12720 [Tateyamaria omphalii]
MEATREDMRVMRLGVSCLALVLLAACGDPLRGIDRVSEGATLPDEPGANVRPTDEELRRQESVLSGLFRAPAEPTGDADVANPSMDETGDQPTVSGEGSSNALAADGADTPVAQQQVAPASRGLLGWLRGAGQSETTIAAQEPAEAETAEDLPVQTAALAQDDLVEPQKRRGLFGAAGPHRRAGPDAMDVAPGMVVPFGQIARNCDVTPAQVATRIDKAAGRARGFALYDTTPDSTAPRTFYVTGFADSCARQFTAALAMFGEPAFHEQLRYGLPADEYPYSTTDEAYEKLKRRVCNVGRNKPCGNRIDRLSGNTTFISAYENFTDNGRWADMLLHDGAVLAAALKTP